MTPEIFLVWTLMNGEVKDVDSFMDLSQCEAYMTLANESLSRARESGRKEIAEQIMGISLVGCNPVKVNFPAPPAQKKESM